MLQTLFFRYVFSIFRSGNMIFWNSRFLVIFTWFSIGFLLKKWSKNHQKSGISKILRCHRKIEKEKKSVCKKVLFYILLIYFIPNFSKFHCATPSILATGMVFVQNPSILDQKVTFFRECLHIITNMFTKLTNCVGHSAGCCTRDQRRQALVVRDVGLRAVPADLEPCDEVRRSQQEIDELVPGGALSVFFNE